MSTAVELSGSLSRLIEGFWTTQLVGTAVLLGIPDALAESPLRCGDLAQKVAADPACLWRVVRALHTLGICRATGDRVVELTEMGRLLLRDADGSMYGRSLFTSGLMWKLFGDLPHVVRTGRPTAALPTGREGFRQLATQPGVAAMHRAMVESSVRVLAAAVEVHDFGKYARVLDVGGGYGGALGALLARYPHMSGDVLDLDYLSVGAREYLHGLGVGSRAGHIGGDFFDLVPSGYDCYLLKYIIHDWGDSEALEILSACAAAAGASADVVLLERVVPEQVDESHQDIMEIDLAMMATGGKERTALEYRELLASAGLNLAALVPTRARCDVILARRTGAS